MAQQAGTMSPSPEGSTATAQPASQSSAYPINKVELKHQLLGLGADKLDLMFPETGAIPYVLHPGERMRGITYGRYKQDEGKVVGRGVLIATDDRVFLLDKKPTYVKLDEVIYDAISGIAYGRVFFTSTVLLHTKQGEIRLRTFNQKAAYQLVEAIEDRIYGRSLWKVRG